MIKAQTPLQNAKCHILFITDNKDIPDYLTHDFFRRNNFEIILSTNFNNVNKIPQVSVESIIAIIIDNATANINANQILDDIKNDLAFRNTPIFIIMEKCQRAEMIKWFILGANEIITTPLEPNRFVEIICRYLTRIRAINEPNFFSETHAPSLAILDVSIFDYERTLRKHNNDDSAVQILIPLFLLDVPSHYQIIQEALQRKDIEKIITEIHKLKGTTNILYLPLLRDAAMLVLRSINEFGLNDQVEQFIAELLIEIERAAALLTRYYDRSVT